MSYRSLPLEEKHADVSDEAKTTSFTLSFLVFLSGALLVAVAAFGMLGLFAYWFDSSSSPESVDALRTSYVALIFAAPVWCLLSIIELFFGSRISTKVKYGSLACAVLPVLVAVVGGVVIWFVE